MHVIKLPIGRVRFRLVSETRLIIASTRVMVTNNVYTLVIRSYD